MELRIPKWTNKYTENNLQPQIALERQIQKLWKTNTEIADFKRHLKWKRKLV